MNDQLLNVVVGHERPDLEEQYRLGRAIHSRCFARGHICHGWFGQYMQESKGDFLFDDCQKFFFSTYGFEYTLPEWGPLENYTKMVESLLSGGVRTAPEHRDQLFHQRYEVDVA